MKRRTYSILFSLLMVILVLSGCQSGSPHSSNDTDHSENGSSHIAGDRYELTAGVTELPSFLNEFDPQIAQIYQLAAQNEELLQWIPCYCGCGQSVQHKSNRECFVREVKDDGQIEWTSHGTTCGVCLETAVESVQLKQQGKSDLEIRKYIDQKYAQGYAEPTPTPFPSK